jgi:hypothetical protein
MTAMEFWGKMNNFRKAVIQHSPGKPTSNVFPVTVDESNLPTVA